MGGIQNLYTFKSPEKETRKIKRQKTFKRGVRTWKYSRKNWTYFCTVTWLEILSFHTMYSFLSQIFIHWELKRTYYLATLAVIPTSGPGIFAFIQ